MRGADRARRLLARAVEVTDRRSAPDGYDHEVVRLLFDPAYYRSQIARPLRDPLAHYLRDGWRAGLDPHRLFATTYYLDANSDVADADMCPLVHYARWGASEGRRPDPLFDPGYYRDRYLDVSDRSIDVLAHFVRFGGDEGRDPNPWFDTRFYVAHAPEQRASGTNPLLHYVTVGWRAGRNPHPDFDVAFYRAINPDLGDHEPLEHFLTTGSVAGREPCADYSLRPLLDRRGAGPVQPFRLVVLSDVDPAPPRVLATCPTVQTISPAEYVPRAEDYVYAPDDPLSSLSAANLISVALCLAHLSYDFVVVSHDRARGSAVTAASAANAVVLSAAGYLRRRDGPPVEVGSVGRFLRLPSEQPHPAIPLDALGLGALMRFDAELVVVGASAVRPPIVARRRPAGPLLASDPGGLTVDVAELGPADLHEAMRWSLDYERACH